MMAVIKRYTYDMVEEEHGEWVWYEDHEKALAEAVACEKKNREGTVRREYFDRMVNMMAERDALQAKLDKMADCSECGNWWYYSDKPGTCPACNAEPQLDEQPVEEKPPLSTVILGPGIESGSEVQREKERLSRIKLNLDEPDEGLLKGVLPREMGQAIVDNRREIARLQRRLEAIEEGDDGK